MRSFFFFFLAATACASARNAPPRDPATPPAKPIGAFVSPALQTTISPLDREAAATTSLLFRMSSNRIAFGLMKDDASHGDVAHPMQALVLPDDVIDAAILEDTLCTLKRSAKVLCADVRGGAHKDEFTVDADAQRFFFLAKNKRCVLRATGDWSCFMQEFSHPWDPASGLTKDMNAFGPGASPVPGSRCFITRGSKLVCFDEDASGPREVMSDVTSASVGLGRGDFSGGCAARADGTVACWTSGINEMGVLGMGERGPQSGPQKVLQLHDVIAVAHEPEHACALTKTHDVWCWGSADGYAFGEAAYDEAKKFPVCADGESPGGNSCITASPFDRKPHQRLVLVPRLVPELHGVVSIAAGSERTCGVRRDGRLLCLGGGYAGAWTADLDAR